MSPLETLGQAVIGSMEPTSENPNPELCNKETQAAVKAYRRTLNPLERLGANVVGAYERRDGRRAAVRTALNWYTRMAAARPSEMTGEGSK